VPRPALAPRQSAQVFLNRRPLAPDSPNEFASLSLLRFTVRGIAPPPTAGPVSEPLRREFANNGVSLTTAARIDRPAGGSLFRVLDDPSAQVYHVDAGGAPWVVLYGLQDSDLLGTIAFQFSNVPPGQYLVRYRVDNVDSRLKIDKSTGEYVGPEVTVV
jgi:hypothetical protein